MTISTVTGHRIKYTRVDADTGEEVASEDIMKGFKLDTDTYVEVTKDELENVALEFTRTIEIDEFVQRDEIDPRYIIRPYYMRPDGKVGHDAFAVIRETIREMNKVAIGRVVLTSREHIIALEPLDKGLMGAALPLRSARRERIFRRYPGRQSHRGHARPGQAHRQPKGGTLRARKRVTIVEARDRCGGGGGANGAFLRAGLVDELNLILCPAVDGAKGAPSVFDSPEAETDERASVTAMALESSRALEGGAMLLRYRIQNADPAAEAAR
jgi:hypothetical protein